MSDWDWDWDVLPLHKQFVPRQAKPLVATQAPRCQHWASSSKLELHLLFLISLYLLQNVVVVVVLLPCCLGMAPLMFRLSSEFALSNWLVGSASRPARYIFALHFSLSCFFLPFTFPQTFGLSLWPFRLHCLCSSCHARNAVVQLIFLSISPIYLSTLVPCATNTQYASFTPSFLTVSLRHCSFPPACFVSLSAALTQLVANCPLPVCKLLSRQLPLACLPVASTHKFRLWFQLFPFPFPKHYRFPNNHVKVLGQLNQSCCNLIVSWIS